MRLTERQLEGSVVAASIALAIAVGIWIGDAVTGTVVAALFAFSMWTGTYVGGRSRVVQGLVGLTMFLVVCAAAIVLWIAFIVALLGATGTASID